MKKLKDNLHYALMILILIVAFWLLISITIQAVLHPSMTQTELLINIPKSFICDWD